MQPETESPRFSIIKNSAQSKTVAETAQRIVFRCRNKSENKINRLFRAKKERL